MIEAVIVGGTSPYTYSWNTGAFSKVITGLGAGTYTFMVTDANNQTISSSVELLEPMILNISAIPKNYSGYNVSEQGGSDGSIDVEVTGGSSDYLYSWSMENPHRILITSLLVLML